MADNISGRTALITGGAKRVGRAVAFALAKAGVNVVISYRSSSAEAEELVKETKKLGVKAWSIKADLGITEEREGLIDRVYEKTGKLDILVNNASVFPGSEFATLTFEELQENIKTDAWAPLVLGRRFAAKCEKGHIVNMLDSRVVGYDWMHVGYHAGKYLLGLFSREMAIQFAPKIAVNAVAPGLILPPEGKDMSYLESLKDRLPMKRVGDPGFVADAVLFLVSSNFITGQVIFVDGGRHLTEVSIG